MAGQKGEPAPSMLAGGLRRLDYEHAKNYNQSRSKSGIYMNYVVFVIYTFMHSLGHQQLQHREKLVPESTTCTAPRH